MSLDNALWFAGILTETVVVALLVNRRIGRILPLFLVYCIWDLISNVASFTGAQFFHFDYSHYLTTYLVESVVDSALQFGVLVELAWSVLRPIRSSLSRSTLLVVAAAILALGAMIWPFAVFSTLAHYSLQLRIVIHLLRTVSMLRIVLFLLLAAGSQWLSIGWRDRELQVATGLGFYSLFSLLFSILQPHLTTSAQYVRVNQLIVGSFLCSLLYWVFSFAQKETARRDFTPQMQSFILAMAGAARSTRTALSDARESNSQRRDSR